MLGRDSRGAFRLHLTFLNTSTRATLPPGVWLRSHVACLNELERSSDVSSLQRHKCVHSQAECCHTCFLGTWEAEKSSEVDLDGEQSHSQTVPVRPSPLLEQYFTSKSSRGSCCCCCRGSLLSILIGSWFADWRESGAGRGRGHGGCLEGAAVQRTRLGRAVARWMAPSWRGQTGLETRFESNVT